jgi:E3 ubiquitin-protein ligase HERC3
VKCWGFNTFGQLGLGDVVARGDAPGEMGNALPAVDLGTGRSAVELRVGGFHSCARLDNGQVKCWGSNNAGQLGLGDANHRGDVPGEMGNLLPAIQLGTGRSASTLALGRANSCAVLDDASLKCWGDNFFGQLGQGDKVTRGTTPASMGNGLPAIALGTGRTVFDVWGGGGHICSKLDNGAIKCWGGNANGQLGLEDSVNRGDNPGELDNALPIVDLTP